MVKLFLSGGGDAKQTKEIDKEFISQVNLNKPLLYIPIALKGAISYELCFEWINSTLNPLGVQNIVMWTDLSNKSIKDLNPFSAVYIGGGNTFSLLHDIRVSGFDLILREYIKNGLVYGGSAGAIIFGKDINTASYIDINNVNMQDYSGLNLTQGYSIWCHYQEKYDELIKSHVKKTSNPIMALSEEVGVYISHNKLQALGDCPLYVFKKDRLKVVKTKIISGDMLLS
ncbi:peptidase [Bacillus endophyticus]|uniref:Type 1 glutamine amidotransferase-like domain-containing protein n=1 Tax=Priestia endophytica TaxID=135735 RepID=UPI0018CE1064|nr:Type 1 glutamine amidotransferase-like domain-containing protein [Priestia endophytica]MBG9812424.1 peptidase [Priestia endophytica]